MANSIEVSQNSFLYPRSRYYGRFSPEAIAFNANMQEFAQRVSYISALGTAGKLSPEQAYEQVKGLWKQLKSSKKVMNVGAVKPPRTT